MHSFIVIIVKVNFTSDDFCLPSCFAALGVKKALGVIRAGPDGSVTSLSPGASKYWVAATFLFVFGPVLLETGDLVLLGDAVFLRWPTSLKFPKSGLCELFLSGFCVDLESFTELKGAPRWVPPFVLEFGLFRTVICGWVAKVELLVLDDYNKSGLLWYPPKQT